MHETDLTDFNFFKKKKKKNQKNALGRNRTSSRCVLDIYSDH